MRRAGFSFFIAWVMVSLAVNSVAAQRPALTAVEGPTPTPVPPVPLRVLQFLADHVEIDIIALILAIIGAIWAAIRWGIPWLSRRFRPPPVTPEPFPFRIITDPAEVLRTLLPGEGPLADHAVPHQPRVTGRDIQREMQDRLIPGRYLLVKGRRGVGKTREAGMLAEALCHEGATILSLRRDAWLDVPASYPSDLPDRNLVLFLDRLELHCGKKERPPVKEAVSVAWPSFQERLRKTLEWFERTCGEREIRVIATARDEPDEWAKLDYKEHEPLWRRFALYDLPLPEDKAVVGVLAQMTKELAIESKAEEFPQMAGSNDDTMRNVVENLKLAEERGSLMLDEFRPTLEGSYRDSYQIALHRHPVARYEYDALDIMLQVGVTPFGFLVRDLAGHLSGGNIVVRRFRRGKLNEALDYLVNSRVIPYAEGVFEPRDGQIEERHERGERVDIEPHLEPLALLILDASRQRGRVLVPSLHGLGYQLAAVRGWKELPAELYGRIVELEPDDALAYINLGNLLYELEMVPQAENAYRRAIELQPDIATAYYNLGNLLHDLERYEEAQGAYRRAIELQPGYATAYNNLGSLLAKLKRYEEAEEAFRRAIELQPDDATAYYNLGGLFIKLKRYGEAEEALQRVIELNPDDATAYFDLGNLLYDLERYQEAQEAYGRAIELQPDYAMAYRNRADNFIKQGRHDEALADIESAASLEPNHPYLHARYGQLYYALKKYEDSAPYYRRAIELDPDRPAFHFDLGLLLVCLDKGREARVEYETGLSLVTEGPELEGAIEDLDELLAGRPDVSGWQEILNLVRDSLEGM